MKVFSPLLAFVLASTCLAAPEPIRDVRWLPLTEVEKNALDALHSPGGKAPPPMRWFTPNNSLLPRKTERLEVFGDRKVYLADDPVGQFLIYFTGQDISAPGAKLSISLAQGESQVVLQREFSPVQTPKVAFLLDAGSLKPGKYQLRPTFSGKAEVTIPPYTFEKSAEKHTAVPFPKEGVPLVVLGQQVLPAAEWPICTGIPLPRATSDTTDRFQLTEDGKPVAAQFSTRATWCPDGSQIKWMGLDFVARYENGKPRDYRLMLLPEGQKAEAVATPLKVTESGDEITVDTGRIRFTVNKHQFAGISNAWLVNADGTAGEQLVKGGAGPYLVDERGYRFEASNDESAEVKLVEKGPVRATIYATGWYVCGGSDFGKGEKLCQFRTQISAYAGQSSVDILHRTIITYDTDSEKLADLGFAINAAGQEQYAFGVDGQAKSGALPTAPGDTAWLCQQRWNQCRILGAEKSLSSGRQSDGWASVSGKGGAVSVMLRNIWQLYPKELELSREAVTLHFWPKHGTKTYSPEEELDPHNLYKAFYAHQGQYLDLKFPQEYYDKARSMTAGTGGVIPVQAAANALTACGQGLAISNEFCVRFEKATDANRSRKQAALYQQNPHAIAEPAWNAKTEVEGRFSASDPKRFGNVEKVISESYRAGTTTPAILEDYGMWIWPDTHLRWSPISRLPDWLHVWNLGYCQNVWGSWLLYLRSAEPWTIEWARNNTAHYMDVGTINYDDPEHLIQGHIQGAMYGGESLLPWGSPRYGHVGNGDLVEVGASSIFNPNAFIISYLVTGDPRGQELMRAWGKSFDRVALPNVGNATLGEMLSYYVTTWDPQAMLYISDLANEAMRYSQYPQAGLQWPRRYWELTRDEQLKPYVEMTLWGAGAKKGFLYQFAALRYDWTKDVKYLHEAMPVVSIFWQFYYSNPGDPLDGYGFDVGAGTGLIQEAPYFVQACLDAGIPAIPVNESDARPVAKVAKLAKDTPQLPDSGWLGTGKDDFNALQKIAWLMPTGAEPTAKLMLTCFVSEENDSLPKHSWPVYVRVENAEKKVLFGGTLLAGSRRPSVEVTLDARNDKGPWKLYITGYDPTVKWSGPAEALFIGPSAKDVAAAIQSGK